MSTGVIFILGKGVNPILASGVKSTWPQGSSAPGFSIPLAGLYIYGGYSHKTSPIKMFGFVSRKPNIFITFAVEI